MSINSNKRSRPGRKAVVASARQRLRAYLARYGLRWTSQRQHVLEGVLRRSRHFDAEELYESLRAAGKGISRATVYRALGHLRDAGLVREVLQCRGRASYEAVYGQEHHDHMLCTECGKVIEFRDERIEELQRRICRRYGFDAQEHRLGIRGVCRECRARRKGSRGKLSSARSRVQGAASRGG
ncbi:MAG: transcriptional repressor [Candidatus Brocadiae bacterium]|nr:transcriptional repressor [Candidatus Brocadiia bacterium]